jgi:hypothetical protein
VIAVWTVNIVQERREEKECFGCYSTTRSMNPMTSIQSSSYVLLVYQMMDDDANNNNSTLLNPRHEEGRVKVE